MQLVGMTIDSLILTVNYILSLVLLFLVLSFFVQMFLPRTTNYKIKSVKRTTLGYTPLCRGFLIQTFFWNSKQSSKITSHNTTAKNEDMWLWDDSLEKGWHINDGTWWYNYW